MSWLQRLLLPRLHFPLRELEAEVRARDVQRQIERPTLGLAVAGCSCRCHHRRCSRCGR